MLVVLISCYLYLRFWLGLWALVVMDGGWEISFVCLSSDCKGVSYVNFLCVDVLVAG